MFDNIPLINKASSTTVMWLFFRINHFLFLGPKCMKKSLTNIHFSSAYSGIIAMLRKKKEARSPTESAGLNSFVYMILLLRKQLQMLTSTQLWVWRRGLNAKGKGLKGLDSAVHPYCQSQWTTVSLPTAPREQCTLIPDITRGGRQTEGEREGERERKGRWRGARVCTLGHRSFLNAGVRPTQQHLWPPHSCVFERRTLPSPSHHQMDQLTAAYRWMKPTTWKWKGQDVIWFSAKRTSVKFTRCCL